MTADPASSYAPVLGGKNCKINKFFMENKKLDSKAVVMSFFIALRDLILRDDKEFIEEETVEEYHKKLEELEKLYGYNLNFSKIRKEDFFEEENNYIVGFMQDSSATTTLKIVAIKKYRKDKFLLKLNQIIILFNKN